MKTVDVVIAKSLNASIGPVQTIRRIKNSRDFFAEQGYDVNVFTIDVFNNVPSATPIKKGSPLWKYKRRVVGWLSMHTKAFGAFKIKQNMAFSRWMINSYINLGRKPDVLVFHSLRDCYIYLKEFRMEGVKTCLFVHDDGTGTMTLSYYPKLKGGKYEVELRNQEQYTYENIDVKACITRITERNLLKRYPVLNGKTTLVVNGISDMSDAEKAETARIRQDYFEPKYRMVQTGSMNGRKGHREIIEALHGTKPEMVKDIHVTFVGDGNEKQELEELVKKYNLSNTVSFVGVVKNQDVYKYLAQGNIAILISEREGLPLALIEGLRSGMGIISTRVSGIPEIVNEGVNGVLINPNVDELVDVFNSLDKYDWEQMGKESRKLFDDYYNFPRMRRDYVKMLEKALEPV